MRILNSNNKHLWRSLQLFFSLFWPVANVFAQPVAQSSSSTSIFSPASTPADLILSLSFWVLAITGVIFLIVGSLLVYGHKIQAKGERRWPRATAGLR